MYVGIINVGVYCFFFAIKLIANDTYLIYCVWTVSSIKAKHCFIGCTTSVVLTILCCANVISHYKFQYIL